ncbi:hypothetical protein D5S17_32900 [Pseudonocardiaceae bacterium YIM PH 21723]|nr:hypothetical protein D5S17_32900 [Pseudonocardiaceae bacterium YIM PH 21723]
MTQAYTPLNPVQVEEKLRRCIADMLIAEKALAAARDSETDLECELKKVQLAAAMDEDCPKVSRGGYTVADREAWIDARTYEQWHALRLATKSREIAADRVRIAREVTSTVQTISQLVRQAFSVVGAA